MRYFLDIPTLLLKLKAYTTLNFLQLKNAQKKEKLKINVVPVTHNSI